MFNGVEDKTDPEPSKSNDATDKPKKDKSKQVLNTKKGMKMKKKMKKKDISVPKSSTTVVTDNIPVINKFKGPYVQIRQNLMSVVNFPINDDEVEKLQSKQRGFNKLLSLKKEKRHMRGMHASTLSIKYDDQTTDHTWICVFCKKGPHKDRMGDLYGPYIIDLEQKSQEKQKKKKVIEATPEHQLEMWTHEFCATMTCGIYMCGTKIIGLEEAAQLSQSQKCMYCELTGATIGCLKRGCKHIGHVICTKQNAWKISDNFQYYCSDHAS